MDRTDRIRSLINRLARLDAAEIWKADLNPVQISALEYLARANRFSRSPSHVADYLGTTRGTMSQTLRTLARKGYLTEHRSEADKRSISYALTGSGTDLVSRKGRFAHAIATRPPSEQMALEVALSAVLAAQIAANGGRPFGVCKNCVHHRKTGGSAFCMLLSLPLAPDEADQICNEQAAA